MLGDFMYSNPTKLYFGEHALEHLGPELEPYGKNVMLVYGEGSIKTNGIYDRVTAILKQCGKTIVEDPGVMPNPTAAKVYEGCERARAGKVDFILAVGGGSVCDYAKAVSVSIHCQEDPWDKYFLRMEDVDNEIVPVGCVLTMVGTGSEMNCGAVISNPDQKLKVDRVFEADVFPKFAILNPVFTYTLPQYQMVAGIYDMFNHLCEQYFSGEDDNTSDYIMEGLMKSVIHSSRIAIKNPRDYEARSNLMWTSTWALNTFVEKGKATDWMVHMIGEAVGAHTDATHGMTLSAVSIPYYKFILPYGVQKFKRFAIHVWGIDAQDKTDEQIALEGLASTEGWMRELGLVMNLADLGVTEEMLDGITESTCMLDGGYRVLTRTDVKTILIRSLG